ncbi:MAG: class I SAM-dependent methyltransferase [Fibrobacteria bacterium]
MKEKNKDGIFGGSVAAVYETHMVPLIFAGYAVDMAERVAARRPSRVLEIAAGTGVVTRAMATVLPASVAIVATDLNPAMLAEAAAAGTSRPVEWKQADAMQLPFPDGSFDATVCQFGAMFFPDKGQAFAEIRRVLAPGGVFIFSVWDKIEENEFAETVTAALAALFPENPPRFMVRIPHGYHDTVAIGMDLAAGGFPGKPEIATVPMRSRAASSRVASIAYCQGTPMRGEIEARDPARLGEATELSAAALAHRFGNGAIEGKIQAHIVSIAREKA